MMLTPYSQLDFWLHEPSWKYILQEEFTKDYYRKLERFLTERNNASAGVLPHPTSIFNAFNICPAYDTRVVIVGQDPYPRDLDATGLAFSISYGSPPEDVPGSLRNIFRALKIDLGITNDRTDLGKWGYAGVLLLNRVLTTERGKAGAHLRQGWEKFTEAAIKGLLTTEKPLVFMLWGEKAQELEPLVKGSKQGPRLVLKAPHPSPQSAHTGFLWSKPFSQANEFLASHGARTIDWNL